MRLLYTLYLFTQLSMCFLTSSTETVIEAYIPYYEVGISKLEKEEEKQP